MSGKQDPRAQSDVFLAVIGVMLGALVAAAYGAFRAISEDAASVSGHWATFGQTMLFPGALIVVAVAVEVWLGWKANIDG